MEIKRDSYLQQLSERKDNGMIKVITGIRRCGKSFLLFSLYDVHHIKPLAYGGSNDYSNLIHLPKATHTSVTSWWAGY